MERGWSEIEEEVVTNVSRGSNSERRKLADESKQLYNHTLVTQPSAPLLHAGMDQIEIV